MRAGKIDTYELGSRRAGRTTSFILALAVLIQLMVLQPAPSANAAPGDVVGTVTEIPALERETDLSAMGIGAPIDPSGIAYLGGNKLLISDSEIEEEPAIYAGHNLWEINLKGTNLVPVGNSEPDTPDNQEPTGLAYNSANGRTYITRDNDPRRIWDIDRGTDGIYGTGDDDRETFNPTLHPEFDPTDLEDAAWDSRGKLLWIANGIHGNVIPISPGPDGLLGGADTQVGTPIDVSSWVADVEGIAYRKSSDTLLVTKYVNPDKIVEITKDGRLVRQISIDGIVNRHPTDLTVAPASDGSGESIYVVDRGLDNDTSDPAPEDGQMFEIDVLFSNLRPFVDAGPNKTVAATRSLTITGDAYDDGQPTPGSLKLTWSKVSGPGTASFTDPNQLQTKVTFTLPGTYVLRLTANDTEFGNTDTMTVTVSSTSQNDPFIDDDGNTFENDIEWIAAEGITKGCNPPTNDRFCPDDFVTRGQMAAFLVRAFGYTDNGGGDLFIDDNGNTFENDIDRLGTAEVTKGCNPPANDRYCPNDFVTRGQMAAFLRRALDH